MARHVPSVGILLRAQRHGTLCTLFTIEAYLPTADVLTSLTSADGETTRQEYLFNYVHLGGVQIKTLTLPVGRRGGSEASHKKRGGGGEILKRRSRYPVPNYRTQCREICCTGDGCIENGLQTCMKADVAPRGGVRETSLRCGT